MKITTLRFHTLNCTKMILFSGIFLAACISLAACSKQSDIKTIKWREEVKLADGQVIIAERSEDYRNVYAGGDANGWHFEHTRIKVMLGSIRKEIVWEGTL